MPNLSDIWHFAQVTKGSSSPQMAPAELTQPGETRRSALWVVFAWICTALPVAVALSRAASTPQWREDLAMVRDVGLVSTGLSGGVTTAFTQIFGLLPLGPINFRAALVSIVALGWACRVLFELCRVVLRVVGASLPRNPAVGPLGAVMAAVATLITGLSPAFQREATLAGGACVSVALGLSALVAAAHLALPQTSEPRSPARGMVALGLVLGALLAENAIAGAVITVAVLTLFALRRLDSKRVPIVAPRRALVGGLIFFAVGAISMLAPALLRPLAQDPWLSFGRVAWPTEIGGVDVAVRITAFDAWFEELGFGSLCAAGAGFVTLAAARNGRMFAAPFAIFAVFDTLMPARAAALLTEDLLAPTRIFALVGLSVVGAVGVLGLVRLLVKLRIPMARTAAVLIVMFHIALVALTSEQATLAADRTEMFAASEWTDAAISTLEPESAVIVNQPALAWRLWAARTSRGTRPDLIVVPSTLLSRGDIAAELARSDRKLEPVIRSYALTGEPGEFEMSRLADFRSVHVEFDASWDKRMVGHLVVDGVWLSYAPQPLGKSDRVESNTLSLAPLERILASLAAPNHPDPSTAYLTADTLRSQARLLLRLREPEAAAELLAATPAQSTGGSYISPTSPYWSMVSLDLALAGRVRREAKR